MMTLPQSTPSPPHLYPQALQIKLYQAFIFSIPILFSIILLLLFYLFYLKRRTSTVSSTLPRTLNQAAVLAAPSEMGLKGNLKEKLPIILFDEDLRTRDSQCCVCLGEFEMKEELHQVPSCKHVFHVDCIRLWLQSNSTCPLCRCSIMTTAKHGFPEPPVLGPNLARVDDENFNRSPENNVSQEQQEQVVSVSLNMANHHSREQSILQNIEGTSGATSTSFCIGYEMGYPTQDSVVLTIQTHST